MQETLTQYDGCGIFAAGNDDQGAGHRRVWIWYKALLSFCQDVTLALLGDTLGIRR